MVFLVALSLVALIFGTMSGYVLYQTMTKATMTAMERMQLEEEERGLRRGVDNREWAM